ncbi:MAG: hypothetical protein AB1529_06860 [Candidatus Micrarchaeota archaeon]
MVKVEADGGLRVREALGGIIRSAQLKPMLDRFKDRSVELGIGVTIADSAVKFVQGAGVCEEDASALVAGSLLRGLSFEVGSDLDLIPRVGELVKALQAEKTGLLTSTEFLLEFAQMLQHSKNADDLHALATICVEVYSANRPGSRPASLSEISNPDLIVEMTRDYVELFLTVRAGQAAREMPAPAGVEQPAGAPAPEERRAPSSLPPGTFMAEVQAMQDLVSQTYGNGRGNGPSVSVEILAWSTGEVALRDISINDVSVSAKFAISHGRLPVFFLDIAPSYLRTQELKCFTSGPVEERIAAESQVSALLGMVERLTPHGTIYTEKEVRAVLERFGLDSLMALVHPSNFVLETLSPAPSIIVPGNNAVEELARIAGRKTG